MSGQLVASAQWVDAAAAPVAVQPEAEARGWAGGGDVLVAQTGDDAWLLRRAGHIHAFCHTQFTVTQFHQVARRQR